MPRFKPKVTIVDKLDYQIFVFEYLSLSRAKQSLEDNRFIKYKKIPIENISSEKTPNNMKDILNQDLNSYVNSVNKNNVSTNKIAQPKMKYLYRSLDNRKYKAILEF